MKFVTNYRDRHYGNAINACDYEVQVSAIPGSQLLKVQFSYDAPAEGFGIGYAAGAVRSCSLVIPVSVIVNVARAAELVANTNTNPIRFHHSEGRVSAVSAA